MYFFLPRLTIRQERGERERQPLAVHGRERECVRVSEREGEKVGRGGVRIVEAGQNTE